MKFRFRAQVLTFAFLAIFNVLPKGDTAVGIASNDANGNGARDASEKGSPAVLMSNGEHIVTTDKAGKCEIAVTDETIVFVIKPRGWMTPVGPGTNVPRFHYVHKPKGSLQTRFAGVNPTGHRRCSFSVPGNACIASDDTPWAMSGSTIPPGA